MISSSAWVPRGYASEFPEKYELNDEEMERIEEMARLQLQDIDGANDEDEQAEEDDSETTNTTSVKEDIEIDDDLKEYDLENYDAVEKDSEGEDVTMFPGLSNSEAKFHHNEDDKDAYLSLPNEEDAQEEKKELQIYPSDNLVLATRTEDDVSFLDVYVYDDGAGAPKGAEEEEEDKLDDDVAKGFVREANLYVHHDIMLPAFPLCVEWINYRPGSESESGTSDNIGNFAAVGTFDPQIEVWDLDCMDKAFPDLILGEPDLNSFSALKKNKKKKKSKSKHITTHHTDAVLSLAHNKSHRNVLASTSADHTVKLWDLNNGTAVRSFSNIHNGKTVSSSQWHPQETQILLTGGYDSYVAITDVRISDEAQMTKRYKCASGEEVENVKWGHKLVPELFYAGTDTGNVYCFDARVDNKPLWTLHAHDAGISSLEVNNEIPGLLSTAAMGEKVVKLWKCPIDNKTGPSMVLSRDFGVGNVLTTSFANDIEVGGHLTIGGVTGPLKMWDVFSNKSVRNSFREDLATMQKRAKEEAKKQGKASRIARKYRADEETVFTVESSGIPDASDSEPEEEEEE